MSLQPGAPLGHYIVGAPLGAGGMGEVYRATDTRLGREVAIKILPAAMASDPEMIERFRREARAVAALNHPHIVTIHSVEEIDGVHFLTMELVGGQSLDQVLVKGPIGVAQILDLGTALGEALAAAHERGVVHRDLKPANVMLTGAGGVKVLDFGLARFHGAAPGPAGAADFATVMHTSAGVVMGTGPYMSPEQVQGREVDHRTDIYSLGVVLHEMTTGRRPFDGGSAAGLFAAILRDVPALVTSERPELPPALADVIARCLEKNPGRRFQTARDLASALRDVRSTESAPRQAPAPAGGASAVRADEGFWVAVLPFKHTVGSSDLASLAEGLTEEIVTGLSRFSYLKVIARGTTERHAAQATDVRAIAKEIGARYVIEGGLRQAGGQLRAAVKVVDASSGANLWAETYHRVFQPDDIFALQDDLVPRIVSTVADWYGVLPHSMSEAVRQKPPGQLTPYEAVLRSFGYFERITPDEHAAVRSGLERAVAQAPGHADGWAMLSMMYGEEHRFDFNAGPDPLGRALQSARRAVDAGHANHFAWLALAQALFFRKEFDVFQEAAARAIALNPIDGSTVEYLAHLIAFSGDWERGCDLAERARQLNPNHPGWYWAVVFLDAYRRGDYERARTFILKGNQPNHFFMQALLAAVFGQLGDREAVEKTVRHLLVLKPDIAATARDVFAKWYLPDLVEHLIDGLRKAGLTIADGGGRF